MTDSVGNATVLDLAEDVYQQHEYLSFADAATLYTFLLARVINEVPPEKRTAARRIIDLGVTKYLAELAKR